ncbi:MAG: carbohydrate ABC transporter permease [Bacillota bacterium]
MNAGGRAARTLRRAWKAAQTLLLYAALIAVALVTTGPFLWLLSTSLKTVGNVYAFPPQIIPRPISLDNMIGVWRLLDLQKYLLNTIHVTAAGLLLTLVVCALAAYPLARMEFPGRNFIFLALVSTLVLPNPAGMVINFLTLQKLRLINTLPAVYLPSVGNAFGIFLLRQTYLSIPAELEDAARVDGAGELTIWWRVALPLAKPGIATLAIFNFMGHWNNFLWPLIVLQDPDKYPIATALEYLEGMFQDNFRYVAAGTMFSMVPVLVVFFSMQRYFVSGLAGALKG